MTTGIFTFTYNGYDVSMVSEYAPLPIDVKRCTDRKYYVGLIKLEGSVNLNGKSFEYFEFRIPILETTTVFIRGLDKDKNHYRPEEMGMDWSPEQESLIIENINKAIEHYKLPSVYIEYIEAV